MSLVVRRAELHCAVGVCAIGVLDVYRAAVRVLAIPVAHGACSESIGESGSCVRIAQHA